MPRPRSTTSTPTNVKNLDDNEDDGGHEHSERGPEQSVDDSNPRVQLADDHLVGIVETVERPMVTVDGDLFLPLAHVLGVVFQPLTAHVD